jgi:polar amino acid transport system permease protein
LTQFAPSQRQLDRDAFRARRTRRSIGIAATSSTLFLLIAGVAIVSSPGWERVRTSFLDGAVARDSVGPVLSGLWLNMRVLAFCAVVVPLLGLAVAVLRTLRGPVFFPLRFLAAAYTDVFRGVPLIILLYIVGFGLPGLRLQGVPTNPAVLGSTAIILTYTAYVAEVFRAGIESVHPSQRAAARSLGLTYQQTMRHVVLPQAVRRVAPPLLNDFVALQKDVGLISVLGAVDAVRAAQIRTAETANFTPYLVAGLAFVLLAIPTARIADHVTMRSIRRQSAAAVV